MKLEYGLKTNLIKARKNILLPELTVVIPTYNERENIRELLSCLSVVLHDIDHEILFVDDDSPDGTAGLIKEIAVNNQHIKCLKRVGRRGRTSACIEGMQASAAPYISVMDADLQHDESILPEMLAKLKKDKLDIVIGSRYVDCGSTGNLPLYRVLISKTAIALANFVLKQPICDPTSGFFIIQKSFFETALPRLSGKGMHGFELLLDILSSTNDIVRYVEFPYSMRARKKGQSKLSLQVILEFISLLTYKINSKKQ